MLPFLLVTALLAADDPTPWTLAECQRIAIAQSPMVAAAKYGVQAIEERERELWWSTWFPTIQVRSLFTLIPQQGEPEPGEPDLSQDPVYFWSRTDITAYLPIYTFGKLSAAQDMATHGIDATNAVLAAARNELAFQVSRAWYTIQLAGELASLIADGEDKIRKAREKLERLEAEDSDEYDQADTFRLRIYEAEVQKLVLGNRKLVRLSHTGLRVAMGLAPTTPLKLPSDNPLAPVAAAIADIETLVGLAAKHRPELRAQRRRVAIAQAQVDLRWAEFFPDFFVAGSFTIAKSTVTGTSGDNVFEGAVFDAIGGGATLGLQLTLDYPQKAARYRRAKAEHARAAAEAAAREGLLRVTLEEAWSDATAHQQMLDLRRRAMKASKSLLTLAAHEYENGIDETATFKSVLDASVTYLGQKSEWARAVHAFNISVARLSRVAGTDITEPKK